MNMPIEVKIRFIENVTKIIAKTMNSFVKELDYLSMALMSLMLILYAKYGLRYFFMFMGGNA